ncbi:MAG: serine protein kinase [Gammaproteobacteria bacterium]|nr:serine protein kinase [Gammaproteobacteria bacterium]NND36193.1 serine protein kinase [Gammaproteobacteria bacterium]
MIVPESKHEVGAQQSAEFIEDLSSFASNHNTSRWSGTFGEFLNDILPADPYRLTRTSHQYIYDMLRWYRDQRRDGHPESASPTELFTADLYGIDDALDRVVEYFKAASAGSDVGRRLLLMLGPPSGGKSSVVILLKRALEDYSQTDEGALYALQGSPLNETPLNLIPASMRPKFRETYGIELEGQLTPHSKAVLDDEYAGDFMQYPVERIFLSEASRVGIGTYAPHDPTTADIADLVGSVDLSKVAEIGDEGDPRAWSWSGAVYAASRGVLEMIEILKVKREFLYLLLTLTQEKNVKVSRFPLIHMDETILAHTNLAEFNKFVQEKENEALLDRMVIVKVPYTLSYIDEARIYKKLVSSAPAFRSVHLDPHVLQLAAVFSILTRLEETDNDGLDLTKKLRLYAGEDVEGFSQTDVGKLRNESPNEGLYGVSPRFVINAISNAITRSDARSLTSMEMLLALKDTIESDARMDEKQKKQWIDFLVAARKDFYNRWVKDDVHRALFASFEDEAQDLLEKYLDEVEASLDKREVTDPITGESRSADERFLRSVEEKIKVSESGKQSFRQEVVRKAMVAFKAGEKFTLESHARLHEAIGQYLFEERRDVLRLVTSSARPDADAQSKITAVQERLVEEYDYDEHSAGEALNYVTTLLSQE